MVEQRNPSLEPNPHAGPVDLSEDVIWKIGDQVQELHPTHKVREVRRQRLVVQNGLRWYGVEDWFSIQPMGDKLPIHRIWSWFRQRLREFSNLVSHPIGTSL